jgi:hypothetical protein
MKRVGAPASRQHVTHSDWVAVSPTPHTGVWEDLGGACPCLAGPSVAPVHGGGASDPACWGASKWDLCVPGWVAGQPASSQARALPWSCRAQGSEQALSPGPGGAEQLGRTRGVRAQVPCCEAPPAHWPPAHTAAVQLWPGCAGTTLALHVAEGVKKLCRPPPGQTRSEKLGDFCTALVRPTADVGGTQTWAVRLHWPESRALSKGLAQCPSCLRFE